MRKICSAFSIQRAYALEIIKETNAESGVFSNCSPVKENWTNGYFGIQGFNLCCVVNFDSARVEVYLGKADNNENKRAFDIIAAHKVEIEEALGVQLIWDRGDDKKSSKIYYKIDDVGIDNEDDWPVKERPTRCPSKVRCVHGPMTRRWPAPAGPSAMAQ